MSNSALQLQYGESAVIRETFISVSWHTDLLMVLGEMRTVKNININPHFTDVHCWQWGPYNVGSTLCFASVYHDELWVSTYITN